jgi:hypothetical protein
VAGAGVELTAGPESASCCVGRWLGWERLAAGVELMAKLGWRLEIGLGCCDVCGS